MQKPKKFQMVLEKDDDYEVDYLTPDEVCSQIRLYQYTFVLLRVIFTLLLSSINFTFV